MKKNKFSKLFVQLAIALPLLLSVVFSSCYTDYGLDTDTNYDVTLTFYNTSYNFAPIQNYFLYPNVQNVGGGTQSSYSSNILSTVKSNLDNLGWNQITDSTVALGTANTMFVGTGEFTTTTTDVSCGYSYGGYYGWYYPDYYCGSTYSYTTGTVVVLMVDRSDVGGAAGTPVQWSGIVNGLTSSQTSAGGSVPTRITNTINQAFTQSPYLR